MIRRFTALALAVLLLAGCGGTPDNTNSPVSTAATDARANNTSGTPLLEFMNDPAISAFAQGFENNTPVAVCVRYQTAAGGEPYWVEDEATIRAVFNALANMAVLEQVGYEHTDDYLDYYFQMQDGTLISGFSFQQGMFTKDGATYSVQGFDALDMALSYPYGQPDNNQQVGAGQQPNIGQQGNAGQQPDLGQQVNIPPVEPIVDIPQGGMQYGETDAYTLFAYTDPVYQMEAFRTLLPEGWYGSGDVSWDYASATAPARCSFGAFSNDGNAGLLRTTDIHYVDQVYSGGGYSNDTFASPDGTPLRKSCTSIEMAYEIPPSIHSGITDMHITGSENADPQGILQSAFEQAMSGEAASAAQLGSSLSNIYCTQDGIYGTATIDGIACEFEAYITMAGYTLQSPGNYVTITSSYWSVLNTLFMYAPVGQLGNYTDDIDIILGNHVENANWLAVRSDVNAQLLTLLREKQLQDWARANEFSDYIYSQAYYNRNPSSDYSSVVSDRQDASSFWHERWEETLTGKENYDLGGGESVTVDGFYDSVYSDGAGNIIGSNDPGYSPGAGYTQLNPITR